jgi:hypothetical protein
MSASKEEQQQPISEESYSLDDQKLIVSLLNEYSEKLLHICFQIDKQKKKLLLFLLYFGGLIISVILLVFAVLLGALTLKPVLFLSGYAAENIFKLTLIFCIFMSIYLFIIFTFYEIKHSIKLLVNDASILAMRLEKVIRIASQIQEHVLSNFVSQLELDLRLTDAELALQHYTDLLKTTKRSFFFRFFL